MAETVTLTVAESVTITNTKYKLDWLHIDVTGGTIQAHFLGDNGEVRDATYGPSTNPTGASLITSLNTSNNTTTSLVKRVYNRVIADGLFAGTVNGTPS